MEHSSGLKTLIPALLALVLVGCASNAPKADQASVPQPKLSVPDRVKSH